MEAAGLIVGVIPLVISAVEHYQSNIGRLHNFLRWRGELSNLLNALQKQRMIFLQNSTTLLRLAGVDVDSSDERACVQALSNRDANARVKTYLGFQADLLEVIVGDYEQCLKDIVRHVQNIKRLPNTAQDDLEAILAANSPQEGGFVFKKRIRFTWKRRLLSDLVRRLREENLNLSQVLQSDHVLRSSGIPNEEPEHGRKLQDYQIVREAAKSLHKALSSAWVPGCHNSHGVLLHVEGQANDNARKAPTSTQAAWQKRSDLEFNVYFSLNGAGPPETSRWSKTLVAALNPSKPDSNRSTRNSSITRSSVSSTPASSRPSSSTTQSSQIKDMCKAINQAQRSKRILALQVKQDCLHERSDGCCRSTSLSHLRTLTLEKFLAQAVSNPNDEMGIIERAELARSLATSILELQSTPWLQEPWTKKIICFFNNSDRGLVIDAARPVVSQVLPNEQRRDTNSFISQFSPTDALVELAILLQEIWRQEPLERWVEKSPFAGRSDDRLYLATCWLGHAKKFYLPQYYSAVHACLQSFRQWSDWEDDNYRLQVAESIIVPLEELCEAHVQFPVPGA